ncbi:hypothetical protein Ciccas_006046 [Cichlidogyrus casuarinus]|uniref:G-protein coupled receptors family 1 profile domain-containing protein n=1 Tax=Cichlidogyrus casuarinus TaxID=1844966 RepID=A0ABD2Q7W8_9PLAT
MSCNYTSLGDRTRDPIEEGLGMSLIVLCSLIGTPGNLLVIAVYLQSKAKKLTSNFFILALACSDFFVCCANIPITIFLEVNQFQVSNSIKYMPNIYIFIITSAQCFSSLDLTSLALDRYLCICHPMTKLMTFKRAKILMLFQVTFSITLGALWFKGLELKETQPPTEGYKCADQSKEYKLAEYLPIFQLVAYACSMSCVLVLYLLIYIKVSKTRLKRKKLKGLDSQKVKIEFEKEEAEQQVASIQQTPLETDIDDKTNALVNGKNVVGSKEKSGSRFWSSLSKDKRRNMIRERNDSKDGTLRQNLKTAMTLALVTLVYITTMIPPLLITFGVFEFKMVIMYLYFINNAINPVIYGFMNPLFRADVRKFFNAFCRRN